MNDFDTGVAGTGTGVVRRGLESEVGEQRLAVRGLVVSAGDPALQALLSQVHGAADRPRCLCMPGGVEMYVARHGLYVVKRLPDTGSLHHPSCPSFDVSAEQSGLGQLLGDAVIDRGGGSLELRVDFPWARIQGRSAARQTSADVREVGRVRRQLSLRGLTHLLFDRAGFNRWTPAMAGKRNQGVVHKYVMDAARELVVKGLPLADRLYVPEPFIEADRVAAAHRRQAKLSVLQPGSNQEPLAMVLGEFKGVESTATGHRVWIRHMPDAPLLVDARTWKRVARAFAPMFEAKDSDGGRQLRLVMTALIRARRERTYEIDTASMMLVTEHWIPIDGVHELPLLQALVGSRRFLKPLCYDADSPAAFANVLLLDAGSFPVPLHVLSVFMSARDRKVKEDLLARVGDTVWRWRSGEDLPVLPPACPQRQVAGAT